MSDEQATSQDIDAFLGTDSSPRWKRWAVIWVPAALLLIAIGAVVYFTKGGEKTQYITEQVTQKSLDIDVTATGNLRPTNQVEVGSEVSGKIDDIYVDVNDRVARGQVLAQINTDVIEDQITQARASLRSAEATVAQQKATLQNDQAQLDRYRQVAQLSGGKVPSKSEMEIAEANVARDKAGVASAQANVVSQRAAL
jgi:HlyD family secretion protein